jgi:iron complex outermembrane receptor protein
MDNSEQENRMLKAFFVQHARASWKLNHFIFHEWNFMLQVNNLFNHLYEPNGYTYSYVYNKILTTENGYYPMAGRNFMAGVNIRL